MTSCGGRGSKRGTCKEIRDGSARGLGRKLKEGTRRKGCERMDVEEGREDVALEEGCEGRDVRKGREERA